MQCQLTGYHLLGSPWPDSSCSHLLLRLLLGKPLGLLVEQLPTLLVSQSHLNINRKSTSFYKIFCRNHLLDLPELLPLVANLVLHNGDFLAETDRLLRLHLLKGKFTKKFFSEPSQPAPESSS